MKKSIIALMGLFTLVACSEDAYQEADKMSETGNVENNSGGMQTNSIDPTIPYESPYNGYNDIIDIPYTIVNDLREDIEITGYFGIAYYDGADDGDWQNFYDLTDPDFSTVYQNSNEYLNLVTSVVAKFPANTTYVLVDMRCPCVGTNSSIPIAFSLDGTIYPFPANGTGQEAEMMHQNGKPYYFDINIPAIGYSGRVKVKFGDDMMDYATLSGISSDWDLIGSNITGIPGDLVYNIHTQEICLANDFSGNGLKSEDRIVDRLGNVWFVRAYTDINSVYIEVTP